MRYPLIDGQEILICRWRSPAAYRYTESRLEKLSDYLLADIEKETVNWAPNFDDSTLSRSSCQPAFRICCQRYRGNCRRDGH